MGLLQKANEHSRNTPQARQEKFNNIKLRLNDVKKTINFHPALFKELVNLFNIEKGALLAKDGNKFSLTSIIGYDETTKHRLRLTLEDYDIYLSSKNKDSLQKYFSIREFKTIDSIIILPFNNNNNIDGLLLITEFSTQTTPSENELQKYVTGLEELWQENPLFRLKQVDTAQTNYRSSIQSFVQRIKNADNRVIFLKLNLEKLLGKLTADDSLSTTSSMKNSIIKVLTSFVNKRGKVFQLKDNKALLVLLDKNSNINVTVMQHQISTTIESVFSVKIDSVNLNYENLTWENNSLDTILDHFLPDENN